MRLGDHSAPHSLLMDFEFEDDDRQDDDRQDDDSLVLDSVSNRLPYAGSLSPFGSSSSHSGYSTPSTILSPAERNSIHSMPQVTPTGPRVIHHSHDFTALLQQQQATLEAILDNQQNGVKDTRFRKKNCFTSVYGIL